MNQEKIGKFIAKMRKDKKLTQVDLAEKLGVSEKSVGNWENGRNMPDLSLFKPLCDILDISVNDLLSGEKVDKEQYNDTFEENIVNAINYIDKRSSKNEKVFYFVLILIGLVLLISSLFVFGESLSNGFINVIGLMVLIYGVNRLIYGYSYFKRLILLIMITFCILGLMIVFGK